MNKSNQQFSNSNVNASPKSRLALTLLAFFLGYLGVDRFYGGRILLGILKLLTFGFGGLWILIDFILQCVVFKKMKMEEIFPIGNLNLKNKKLA